MDLALIFTLLSLLGSLVLEAVLIHILALSAQRKGRSYKNFIWLGAIFRAILIWPIVASMRSEPVAAEPGSYPEPLVSQRTLNTLIASIAAVVIGAGGFIFTVAPGIIDQVSQATAQFKQAMNTVDTIQSLTTAGGATTANTSDNSVAAPSCDHLLIASDVSAGYTTGGSCLAWRWVTKAEQKVLSCSKYSWCTYVNTYALSDCKAPVFVLNFTDADGRSLATDVSTGADLASGAKAMVEVGTSKLKTWAGVQVTSANCGA